MNQYHFITVEGNTGAGKTSLAKYIEEAYNGNLILETFAENPFLADFYGDRARYAFTNEVYFLLDRFQQLKKQLETNAFSSGLNITDYLLNKTLLYAKVNLEGAEYELFKRLFYSLLPKLPQPELVIYIHSTVKRLMQNIEKRGRDFEQVVSPDYLQEVEDTYFDYFKQNSHLTVLLIHADSLDFVNQPDHYQWIMETINKTYTPGVHELKML